MSNVWQRLLCMACLGSALPTHQPDILASSGTHTQKDPDKLEHIWRREGWGQGEELPFAHWERGHLLMWPVASLKIGMWVVEVTELQLPVQQRE